MLLSPMRETETDAQEGNNSPVTSISDLRHKWSMLRLTSVASCKITNKLGGKGISIANVYVVVCIINCHAYHSFRIIARSTTDIL